MHLPFLLLSIGLAMPAMAASPYWTLVWADEFDGPAGVPPDPRNSKFRRPPEICAARPAR